MYLEKYQKFNLAMNHEQATTDQSDVEPSRNVSNAKKLSKEHYIELAAFCDSIYDRGKKLKNFAKNHGKTRLKS